MHKLLLILFALLLTGCSARLPLSSAPRQVEVDHEEDCPDGSCKLPGK